MMFTWVVPEVRMLRLVLTAAMAVMVVYDRPAQGAAIVDFETLSHGQIVTAQYGRTDVGVTINAVNYGGGANLAIVFDTSLVSTTADTDLEGPPWSTGNQKNTNFGKVLIIAKNGTDANGDGLIDNPDDEGSRPAGYVRFKFHQHIRSFGFDLLDVEDGEYNATSGYVALYSGPVLVGRIGWGDLVNPLSPYYDRTIEWGDHSANRVRPITSLLFNDQRFDTVIINFGGSAAIDNVIFDRDIIPEPSSMAMLAVGAFALLRRRRA